MMPQTLWKTIEQFPNYEVSNSGLVRNKVTGKALKLGKTTGGYLQVGLRNSRGRKWKYVHRLVAKAFINNSNPVEYYQVNHKDFCKTNNSVENLEWCSDSYNIRHTITNEHCTQAKLNYKQAGEIRELLLLGAKVRRLADKYEVSTKMIRDIRDGKTWSWIDRASEYLQ